MKNDKKYWIGVASKNHIERGIKLSIFGIGHGKIAPLKRMKSSDMIIFYAPKVDHTASSKENIYQKFVGYGEIPDDEIFSEEINSICMFRRKVRFLSTNEVSIHDHNLIDQLDFIKNKQKWGFPFMRGYVEINKEDFEKITKHL